MIGWPDLVIGAITLFFAWKGFHNGFVAELAGPVAIIIAAVAAFRYPGSLDANVANIAHLGPGSSHVIGTVVFAVIVYTIVVMLAWLLGRLVSLPIARAFNRVAGAVVGAGKALLAAAAVLYVTLFFPLTPDLRADLDVSMLADILTQPFTTIDATAQTFLPRFTWPLVAPLFHRHHV